MDLGLKDKVALVTGAGSQIGYGKGAALILAKEGCHIVIGDIDLEGAKKTAAEVEALGRKAMAVKADITKSAEVNEMVKMALEKFGKIDILVNNAGATFQQKPFAEKTEEECDTDLNLNLKGALNCTRAVLNHMISRQSGKIINISSVAAKMGAPLDDIYAAAKAGVSIFTKSLGMQVISSGINVNAIAPGVGMTNFVRGLPPELLERFVKQTPSGRANKPEDIGNMVAFLASDVSSNIVGQTISVDGGLT
jgi:3-oxoacyl-[acyl-carrier protein] reductase